MSYRVVLPPPSRPLWHPFGAERGLGIEGDMSFPLTDSALTGGPDGCACLKRGIPPPDLRQIRSFMRPICFATMPWKRLNVPLGAGREIRLRYLPREGCSCSESNVHDPDGVTWRHRDDRVVRARQSDHVPSAHLVRLWVWACSFASNITTSRITKMKARDGGNKCDTVKVGQDILRTSKHSGSPASSTLSNPM